MEVRQLNTLIRAAQFQSFSKAAESLGYSQSAVTVQIKALEEELGVRLFDRMNKRVLLTVDGQRFSGICQQYSGYHPKRPPGTERKCRAGRQSAHRHAGVSLLFPPARADPPVPAGAPQGRPAGHHRFPGGAD